MRSKSNDMSSNSLAVIKPRSLDKSNKVFNSLADPKEMYKNCSNSLSDRLAEPSAIFTGTEVQALRICELNPNLSSIGNFEVKAYNFLTKAKLLFHASKFWCGFIGNVLDVKHYTGFERKHPSKSHLFPIIYSSFPISHFLIKKNEN